jgi:hypothetical protein
MNRLLVALPAPLKQRANWIKFGLPIGSILVLVLIGYVIYAYRKQTNQPVAITPVSQAVVAASPTPTPTATPIYSDLNGLPVPAGQQNVRPLAVMIENQDEARPQSGLGEADVVYEAVAEGGITRFMALYANSSSDIRVGPVRSVRPYYISFAQEYGAILAHVGGSQDALDELSAGVSGVTNVDGQVTPSGVFVRDFSRNVAYEHTDYSQTTALRNYAVSTLKASDTTNYTPYTFEDDIASASRPKSQTVNVSVSTSDFAVQWQYDPTNNDYNRVMAGTPHIDVDTSKQIAAKTIVLQQVNSTPYVETYGSVQKTVANVDLSSGGPATVIENGTAIQGTWKKVKGRTFYYNTAGKVIPFVRGLLWVELTYTDSTISITP